jgi:hypothetical protein
MTTLILDLPWILMNCPSFNAAPRIRPRVETSLRILASLINTLLPEAVPPVDLLRPSEAAPHPIDAARADSQR